MYRVKIRTAENDVAQRVFYILPNREVLMTSLNNEDAFYRLNRVVYAIRRWPTSVAGEIIEAAYEDDVYLGNVSFRRDD